MDYSRVYAGDIEANGLLDKVTKLWCIVHQDVESKEIYVYHDFPEFDGVTIVDPFDNKEYTIPARSGTFVEGLREWYKIGQAGGKLAVHNGLGYDKLVIEKFYPKCKIPLDSWVDTLIQSKVQWFDRPTPKGAKSAHGLQAYGIRFGIAKPEIKDWSEMDAFKLHRCIEDVKIQTETYLYLKQEKEKVYSKLNIDFSRSLETEALYRINATKQEINGALVDQDHIRECLVDLDVLIERLRAEIEPQLPMQVKPRGAKITRSEMGELFGYENVKDTHTIVDGEPKVDKPYHKPVVNFTKSKKYKKYYGKKGDKTTMSFPLKKDCIDYLKKMYKGDYKEWEVIKEDGEELVLNANTCQWFDIDEDSDLVEGRGYTKVEFHTTTMTQHEQVKNFLLSLGWEPTEWNYKKDKDGNFVRDALGSRVKTTPKLTEDSYDTLPEGLGLKIAHYNTYQHRRRFLENPKDDSKGLINCVREDGRITTGINNFNTSTGRSSHSGWVNAPSVGALYGEQVRQAVIAPEGRVLVGADMKSAQLSIAAYYADNYDYYKAVADGMEVKIGDDGNEIIHPDSGHAWYLGESGHCVNARMFTLVTDEEWKRAVETQDPELIKSISLRRKKSKGGSFAVIFGASGKKVATTLGIPEELGEEKKQSFLSNIGLDESIATLKKMVDTYSRAGGGYIELPFDYYVWCKFPHKLFNYLDQGTEAVCQKIAVNYFEQELNARKYDAFKIIDYHDEFLVECDEDISDKVGNLMTEAYEYASYECWEWHKKHSKWFNPSFMFNLAAGYKVGKNYLEVH